MYIMLCVKIRREIERVGRVSPMRHESRSARKVRTRRADEIRMILYLCHLFNDRGRFRRRLPDNEHRVAPSMKKRDRERGGL